MKSFLFWEIRRSSRSESTNRDCLMWRARNPENKVPDYELGDSSGVKNTTTCSDEDPMLHVLPCMISEPYRQNPLISVLPCVISEPYRQNPLISVLPCMISEPYRQNPLISGRMLCCGRLSRLLITSVIIKIDQ